MQLVNTRQQNNEKKRESRQCLCPSRVEHNQNNK